MTRLEQIEEAYDKLKALRPSSDPYLTFIQALDPPGIDWLIARLKEAAEIMSTQICCSELNHNHEGFCMKARAWCKKMNKEIDEA